MVALWIIFGVSVSFIVVFLGYGIIGAANDIKKEADFFKSSNGKRNWNNFEKK